VRLLLQAIFGLHIALHIAALRDLAASKAAEQAIAER